MHPVFNSLARGLAVILLTALAAAALVRLAPGYGLDARLTDATLGSQTRAQIGAQAANSGWGTSSAFDQPVDVYLGHSGDPFQLYTRRCL